MGETQLAALMCAFILGSEVETPKKFESLGEERSIRIDCETPTHVIEVGLDQTASARDSVHQAVFSSFLTRKLPMVIIIDRDNKEDRYEQEMRIVTSMLGIEYAVCKKDFLVRWVNTQPWRHLNLVDKNFDVPQNASAIEHCDIGAAVGE